MAVVIDGTNTPTAGGVGYGDGTELAFTTAGSAGGVLYSAGSGAPAFSAAGTSGQVLTSTGSGAPTWAAPSTGAMTLISTVSANNTSQYLTFTNVSGYSSYLIIVNGLQVSTTGANPYLEFGTGAGPTWQTSAYSWVLCGSQGGATFANTGGPGTSAIILGFNGLVSSSSRRYFANIFISGLTGSLTKSVIAQASFYNNGANWTNLTSTGEWNNSSTDVTAVRIDAGYTIVSGSASLYGISA